MVHIKKNLSHVFYQNFEKHTEKLMINNYMNCKTVSFFLTSSQSKANDNFSVRIQRMNQAFLHKCSQGSETPIPGRPRPAIKLSENSSPFKTCICHPRHPSPPSHLEKLLEQWSGNWTCRDSPGLWKAERAMDPDCSGSRQCCWGRESRELQLWVWTYSHLSGRTEHVSVTCREAGLWWGLG